MTQEFDKEVVDDVVDLIRDKVLQGMTVDAATAKLLRIGMLRGHEALIKHAANAFRANLKTVSQYEEVESLYAKEAKDKTWYTDPTTSSIYWPVVKKVLLQKLGEEAFTTVDRSSTAVLGSLRPPGENSFQVRGLVLGYVQSGKTTNFMSVIAKAADAGYRLTIVLAGTTDNLREQTQERLDEQLVAGNLSHWHRLTTGDHDFLGDDNPKSLLSKPDSRLLAVVKKNSRVLHKLNSFLDAGGIHTETTPILIIDDEADQASIDVSPRTQAESSAINREIQKLLNRRKTAYIAYTATPFANILIDPNNLTDIYPRDFVHVLPRPSGYFGAEDLFGREAITGEVDDDADRYGLDMIREVPPEDVDIIKPPSKSDQVDNWDPSVPDSLAEAMRWFIMATAARWCRGARNDHSSMLIHTSMLTAPHEITKEIVDEQLRSMAKDVQNRETIDMIWKPQWENETDAVPARKFELPKVPFEEVIAKVPEVFDFIETRIDNGMSEKRLDYKSGPATVIAIGGNTLSRGLTLEGLVTSYFVRNSSAYDTLLQMGRWFGFRNGYQDLPRIWMTAELAEWFMNLATIEAELRQELSRYVSEGATPTDFQARIRRHPSMRITSAAKMRDAIDRTISFSGETVQTILFKHQNEGWLKNNLTAAENLVSELRTNFAPEEQLDNGSRLFRHVSTPTVVRFLEEYKFHENSIIGADEGSLLRAYIEAESNKNNISHWSVSFFGMNSDKNGVRNLGLGSPLNKVSRSKMQLSPEGSANVKALIGSLDVLNDAGLDADARRELNTLLKSDFRKRKLILLERRANLVGPNIGHLAIYVIDKDSRARNANEASIAKEHSPEHPSRNRRVDLQAVEDIVGIGIFFPESPDPESGVEYVSAPEFVDPSEISETLQQYGDLEAEIEKNIMVDEDE